MHVWKLAVDTLSSHTHWQTVYYVVLITVCFFLRANSLSCAFRLTHVLLYVNTTMSLQKRYNNFVVVKYIWQYYSDINTAYNKCVNFRVKTLRLRSHRHEYSYIRVPVNTSLMYFNGGRSHWYEFCTFCTGYCFTARDLGLLVRDFLAYVVLCSTFGRAQCCLLVYLYWYVDERRSSCFICSYPVARTCQVCFWRRW